MACYTADCKTILYDGETYAKSVSLESIIPSTSARVQISNKMEQIVEINGNEIYIRIKWDLINY